MSSYSAPSTDQLGESARQVIRLDAEHVGVRLLLPFLTILGFVGGYAIASSLASSLLADNSIGCAAFTTAIAGAVVMALLADRVLKRIWPSGRLFSIDAEGLTVHDPRLSQQTRLIWDKRINMLAWHFVIQRGSARAPRGWIVLGCQLVQDDALLTFYTFAPAKQAKALPFFDQFTLLASRQTLENKELPLRQLSEQRRLLKAEHDRWNGGYEVGRDDFSTLITAIAPHISDWQEPQENVEKA